MAVTEELLIKLSVDGADLAGGVNKVNASVQRLAKSTKTAEGSMAKLKQAFKQAQVPVIAINQGLDLLSRTMRASQAIFGSTIGQFADFETALVSVGKTTSLSGDTLANFGEGMKTLSETIPITANNLLSIASVAGQLGVDGAANLEKFTETVSKIGVTTDLTAEAAATQFARILTVTGENVDQIDKLASTVVRMGNNFAASESEITRVATEVARSTGFFANNSSQIIAISTALKQFGNQAQLGGSVVGRVFRKLDSVTRETSGVMVENLSRLTGIVQEDLRKAFDEDAVRFFERFVQGMNRADAGGQSFEKTLKAFGLEGDEVNKVMPVMAARIDVFSDALNQADDELQNTRALNEEAAKAFDTLNSRIQILQNTAVNLATDIGETLEPAFKAIVEGLTTFIQSLRIIPAVIRELDFRGVAQDLGAMAVAVTTAVAAFKVGQILLFVRALDFQLGKVLLQTIINFKAWLVVQKANLIVMAKTAGVTALMALKFLAIGAAIAGTIIAVEFLINNFEKISKVVKDTAIATFEALILVVKKVGVGILGFLKGILEPVAGSFADVGGIATATLQKVEGGLASMKVSAQKSFDDTKAAAEKAGDSFKNLTENADLGLIASGADLISDAMELFGEKSDEAGKKAEEAFMAAKKAAEDTKKPITDLNDDIDEMIKRAEDALRAFKRLTDQTLDFNQQAAAFGRTEAEAIRSLASERRKQIEAVEKQLRDTNQLVGREKELAEAVKAVDRLERAQLKNIQVEATEALIDANKDLANQIELAGLDREDAIRKELELQLEALDLEAAKLEKEGLLNDALKKQFAERKKLLGIQAESQLKTTVGDVGGGIAAAFDPGNIVAAFSTSAAVLESAIDNPVQALADVESGLLAAGGELTDMIGNITLESVGSGMMSAAEGVGNILGGILSGEFVNQLTGFLDQLMNLPQMILEGLMNLGDLLETFVDRFPELVDTFVQQLPIIINAIIDAIPKVVQAIIDNLPAMAKALVDGIVRLIPQLAQGIADVFPVLAVEMAKAVGPIISAILEALPVLIEGLLEGIIQAIPHLVESIVQAFQTLVKVIPEIFTAILEKLPALVEALAEAIPILAFAFVDGILDLLLGGGLEKIIGGILRAIPRIVVALVNGLVKGLQKAIGKIFGAGGESFTQEFVDNVKLVGEKAGEGLKKIADSAKGASEQLFQVLDLEAEARGTKVAEDIAKAIESATTRAADRLGTTFNTLRTIWDRVIEFFQKIGGIISDAWKGVIEFFKLLGSIISDAWKGIIAFFSSLGGLISDAWKGILKFFQNLPETISNAWKSILEFFKNLPGTISDAWKSVMDFFGSLGQTFSQLGKDIWSGLSDASNNVSDFFKSAGGQIWQGLKDAGNSVAEFFKGKGGDIWQGLKGVGSELGNFFFEVGKKLAEGLKQGIKDIGGAVADFFNLNTGGLVPAMNTGGVVPGLGSSSITGLGKDTVPAMLTPGEFVINRLAANALGIDFLEMLNKGMIPSFDMFIKALGPVPMGFQNGGLVGGGVSSRPSLSVGSQPIIERITGGKGGTTNEFNIELKIENKGRDLDEGFIRNRIIPATLDSIKRASLDGRFIISQRGIR